MAAFSGRTVTSSSHCNVQSRDHAGRQVGRAAAATPSQTKCPCARCVIDLIPKEVKQCQNLRMHIENVVGIQGEVFTMSDIVARIKVSASNVAQIGSICIKSCV
jgi:hypothetical protein